MEWERVRGMMVVDWVRAVQGVQGCCIYLISRVTQSSLICSNGWMEVACKLSEREMPTG